MPHSTKLDPSPPTRTITTPTSQVVVNALYPSAIGVDVHHDLLVCAYQFIDFEAKEIKTEIAEFSCGYAQIQAFASWCRQRNPDVILMESTGVLWRSPYEQLEAVGFTPEQLALVNARDVKAIAGRKTDKQDAVRLAEIARLGKFSKSFIPSRDFRDQRSVARAYRKAKGDYSRALNRYQKTLNSTGCRASNVFSNVNGVSARKIIDAVVSGVPNLMAVIKLNCRRLKATPEEIYNALCFNISAAQKSLLEKEREHLHVLQKRCEDIFEQLKEMQQPYEDVVQRMMTIPGIKEIAARLILAELSDDLSAFPDAEHLASWAGICPGNNKSAGKEHGSRAPKGNKYLRVTLIECAQAIGLSRRGELFERFLAFRAGKGRNKAIVAIAHKLLRVLFAVIRKAENYCAQPTNALRDVRISQLARAVRSARYSSISICDNFIMDQKSGEILRSVDAM